MRELESFYVTRLNATGLQTITSGPAVIGGAVAGGFSPMFLRMPAEVSGAGFTVSVLASADPNLLLYWTPA